MNNKFTQSFFSRPHSWEHMKRNIMHNDNLKTFDDFSCHLELESERLEIAKANGSVFLADSDSHQAFGHKCGKDLRV